MSSNSMTRREALQAMLEYQNDNLLDKALIDRGVSSPSAIYSATDARLVELAAADVYLMLLSHPDIREGSKYTSYAKGALRSLRREILVKWGEPADPVGSSISVPQDSRYNKSW